MPLPPISPPPKPSKSSTAPNGDEPRSALHSAWITRLRPDHPPPIPLHVRPIREGDGDDPGFGPFRLKPVGPLAQTVPGGPLSQYRRWLSGVCGPAHELAEERDVRAERGVVESSSSGIRREGSGSRDGAHDVNARRYFGNPQDFYLYTANRRHQRQNHSSSSEPEEPFSYWNMGRLKGTDFVSAACPVSLSTLDLGRKRAANTYGFNIPKIRRLDDGD